MFASCMFVLFMTSIGLALVPTKDYWLLVLLRCIQAAGSTPTIALGAEGSNLLFSDLRLYDPGIRCRRH